MVKISHLPNFTIYKYIGNPNNFQNMENVINLDFGTN